MDIDVFKPKVDIITLEELTLAIQNSISKRRKHHRFSGISAEEIANRVMNFFGFNDRLLDNKLTPYERDVFYFLEDHRILGTERENTTLWDGRDWKINYWKFKKDNIHQFARELIKPKPKKPYYERLYTKVPEEIWAMKQNYQEVSA